VLLFTGLRRITALAD